MHLSSCDAHRMQQIITVVVTTGSDSAQTLSNNITIVVSVIGSVLALFVLLCVCRQRTMLLFSIQRVRQYEKLCAHPNLVKDAREIPFANVLSDGSYEYDQDKDELRDYIGKRLSWRRYNAFHCAAMCNADLDSVRLMLEVAPDLVAAKTWRGHDAIQVGVRYRASPKLIAELVVRCLQTGVEFNGWHYLLKHKSCTAYVNSVIDLVEQEAPAIMEVVSNHQKSTPILMQLTGPAQAAVGWLASLLDSKQRLATNMATQQHRELLECRMLYLGRYRTSEATVIHDSETSLIIIAEDLESKRGVAIKLMAHEDQWLREMNMRQTQEATFLGSHVLEILDVFIDHETSMYGNQRPFLITMPAAQMDLSDFLSHNRVAGSELEAVVDILRQVGQSVQYLHQCGVIHGDLKPKNIGIQPLLTHAWIHMQMPMQTHAHAHAHACTRKHLQ